MLEDAKREAQIFRALGTDEPLAIAMNAETAVQVMKGIETLPDLTELEKRLKKAGFQTADWPADEKMENVPFPVASASKFSAAYKEINQRNIARHEENGAKKRSSVFFVKFLVDKMKNTCIMEKVLRGMV